MLRSASFALVASLLTASAPGEAHAFSTRVHIMLANKLRDAVVAGNGSIALWQGGHAVVLSADDTRAILNEPEAFRAGAIGPDNMVLPGLTDPSHAVHQRPFEQCERLYEAAVLDSERAYAMGCFLHGTSDVVAHQYVNFMSGETFTLNPISSGREESLSNVVRHILAEDMIRDAAYAADPAAFSGEALAHTIPTGFLLRTYFDRQSPVHALMAQHAIEKYNATIDANPGASLPEVIGAMGTAPADQFVLLPVYVEQIHATRAWLRGYLEDELAAMQDWDTPDGAELLVWPGDDGVLGTKDDETDCSTTCAQLFVRYFVFAGLLETRYDAGGNALPPAFDKVSAKLGADLDDLLPSLMQVVQNVSTRLNTGLDQGGGGIADFTPAAVQTAFFPLVDWSNRITTIDSQVIATAVSPGWLLEMDAFFQAFGIEVDVSAWIEAILEPVIAPIRDGIRREVIDRAQTFLDDLKREYTDRRDSTLGEFGERLAAALPPELGTGSPLGDFYRTGLYGHSFNLGAAALGNHAVVLPEGEDPIGHGPASFDCSHTARWMQAGVCDYLRQQIFPLGEDTRGALSILRDGTAFPAIIAGDSPIECHEGSLSAFTATPSALSCGVTSLDALRESPVGSISRGFPPEAAGETIACRDLVVPGLPGPESGGGQGGAGLGGGAADDDDGPGGPRSGDGDAAADDAGGCACRAGAGVPSSSGPGGAGSAALAIALAAALVRRRRAGRRPARRAAVVVGAALVGGLAGGSLVGCAPGADEGGGGSSSTSEDDDDDDDDDDGTGGDPVGPSSGGAGPSSTAVSGASVTSSAGQGGGAGQALLDSLDDTVWSALLDRDGALRAYELSFDGARWALVQNPFGPARIAWSGEMVAAPDGRTLQAVDTTSGEVHLWDVGLVAGAPRTLRLGEGSRVDELREGEWPAPTTGLTAEVRVFSSSGAVADAYCKAGGCGIDYDVLFAFARGANVEQDLGRDVVAGSELYGWYNVENFAVTDVDGFDFGTLGGTLLSDQHNFVVRYTGWVEHPGGLLGLRERDDDVGELSPSDYGGVWAFIADDVGAGGFDELFLGVNAFGACSDGSDDEPLAEGPAQAVPLEIIMVRCNSEGPQVDVEMSLGGGDWLYVGNQPTEPDVSPALFPAAL